MPAMRPDVASAKAVLRASIEAKLAAMNDTSRSKQSQQIIAQLLAHPAYKASRRVSVYLSTSAEVDTVPILEDLFRAGKACFVPRYAKGRPMEMVRLASIDDYRGLPLTRWNIRQPSVKEDRENALLTGGLDLVIAPGVAFTKDGSRLGHGAGYYDAFLAGLGAPRGGPTRIALAFREQLLEEVPMLEHDVPMHFVLTATDHSSDPDQEPTSPGRHVDRSPAE